MTKISNWLGLTVILFLVGLVLSACTGGSKVQQGDARDTMFSVEYTNAGAYAIFLTHDDSVVYCTVDEEMGKLARNLLKEHDGEVYLQFESRDFADNDVHAGKCPTYWSGDSSFVVVRLTYLDRASSR